MVHESGVYGLCNFFLDSLVFCISINNKGFARGRLDAALYARGRKNEHSVGRRKRSTNGETGDLKMPRGSCIVQR